MTYIAGDFWRICDKCGRKVRQSNTRKEWNGLWVCKEHFETRQPQDFVKGLVDKQAVSEPRPEQTNYFLDDNEVTADGL